MALLMVAVVLSLGAVIVKAQDCASLANVGNCEFYTQCVEERFQCGTIVPHWNLSIMDILLPMVTNTVAVSRISKIVSHLL